MYEIMGTEKENVVEMRNDTPEEMKTFSPKKYLDRIRK
jgi:hypothetical protein